MSGLQYSMVSSYELISETIRALVAFFELSDTHDCAIILIIIVVAAVHVLCCVMILNDSSLLLLSFFYSSS